jgi:hypothetical protein
MQRIPRQASAAELQSVLNDPIIKAAKRRSSRGPVPSRNDAVFRFAAAWFAVWVVCSSVTSPVANLRPAWWPVFLGIGGLIAASMLVGACMTVRDYLEHSRR